MFVPQFVRFLLLFWKPIALIGAFLGVLTLTKCEAEENTVSVMKDVAIESAKENAKVRNDISNLSDSDLSNIVFFNDKVPD